MDHSRFSLFRDASGYLNFRVIDKDGAFSTVSADVSSWQKGQQHHVAAAWALSSKNKRDELHLFIDGQETPNILRYGGQVSPLLHQKARTVSTEEIIGQTTKAVVGSYDLRTSAGSSTASSSLNFTALGVAPGDTLYVEEEGFLASGYTIASVSGQTLTLTSPLPLSSNASLFSVNRLILPLQTAAALYPNVAVYTLHALFAGTDLHTTANSATVSSDSRNFETSGTLPGSILKISGAPLPYYTVTSVSGNNLTLSDELTSTGTSSFISYSTIENELPGKNAVYPSYSITHDGYSGNFLNLTNGAAVNDVIFLRTLGLNHRRVRQNYYVWGNSSNVLNTKLPPPILLGDVKITHVILPAVSIGPSNSTLSGGIFTSQALTTDQPSSSSSGRTLSITLSGDNIDYTTPATVQIIGSITETLTFTANGIKSTTGKFSSITSVQVTCKPAQSSRSAARVKISELQPITIPESSSIYPVIRYSYQMLVSNQMVSNGTAAISDQSVNFTSDNVGNYLLIHSPPSAAGQYLVQSVSQDLHSLTLDRAVPGSFSNGNYEILNVVTDGTGFQNGKFVFEKFGLAGTAYPLKQGYYEFDYHTYLSVPLEAAKYTAKLGSDISGLRQAKMTFDDFAIQDALLRDVRVGDTSTSDSVTKHFNSLKTLKPSNSTLMLLDFENEANNQADFYLNTSSNFIQSLSSVNNNFGRSVLFNGQPLSLDNSGILDTRKEGTIEFWVSPLHDTSNDPNYRFYFDASSSATEKILSVNNATVQVSGRISRVLSVRLQNGDQSRDYYAGGSVDPDGRTIYLNQKLPGQNTRVIVNYVPTGVSGDRISIYRDDVGYINFNVVASGLTRQIRAPIFWRQGSWHRIRAQYRFNQGVGYDQLRLFVDGKERGNILYGQGLLFGQHQVYGSAFIGYNDIQAAITFKDTVNEVFIGTDSLGLNNADALMDNLKISNVFRPILLAFGESIDPGYSSNQELVFPAPQDLYTTYMLNFDTMTEKTTDFAILRNKRTGLSDITVKVFDSYGILEENQKSKTVLETLLQTLKPANSRLFIQYP